MLELEYYYKLKGSEMDTYILPILEKSLAGERLDFDDCLALFKSHDLLALGHAADVIRQRQHPEGLCYLHC